MKRTFFRIAVIAYVLCYFAFDGHSQCAMCRAVIESNQNNGGSTGIGINNAIIYMIGTVYFTLIGGGVFLFKQRNSSKDKYTHNA